MNSTGTPTLTPPLSVAGADCGCTQPVGAPAQSGGACPPPQRAPGAAIPPQQVPFFPVTFEDEVAWFSVEGGMSWWGGQRSCSGVG